MLSIYGSRGLWCNCRRVRGKREKEVNTKDIFLGFAICAGVNMSLLSKVMSPRLSRGVFNCGLLSTEAGTLARALADGLITVAGKEGVHNLINLTMIPTFFIVVFTTLYTWIGYYSLYWWCGVGWPWFWRLFFFIAHSSLQGKRLTTNNSTSSAL